RYFYYAAHQIRLCHEAQAKDNMIEWLKSHPTHLGTDFDWAMKYLPRKYREGMHDWFGKSGLLWHGVKLFWWDTVKQKVVNYFVRQIGEGTSTESAITTIQLLALVLQEHNKHFPDLGHTEVVGHSDGVACYSSKEMAARMAFLKRRTGIALVSACTGESGGGKSDVDASFGCTKAGTVKTLTAAMGACDITGPQSLCHAIHQRLAPNHAAYVVNIKGVSKDKSKAEKNKEADGAQWQSNAYRTFEYDAITGTPLTISLFGQSSLGGAPRSLVHVDKLWPDNTTLDTIIPQATVSGAWATVPVAVKDWLPPTERTRQAQKKRAAEDQTSAAATARAAEGAPAAACGLVRCNKEGCIRVFANEGRLQLHLLADRCQANGAASTQSSAVRAPGAYDGLTTLDVAIDYMLERTSGMTPAVLTLLPQLTLVHDMITKFLFGWASRITLRHPPLTKRVQELIHWAWLQGGKSPYKYTPAALLEVMRLYGTEEGSSRFPAEPLWQMAYTLSAGRPVFRPVELPEEWRLKTYMSKISQCKKKAAKSAANARVLTQSELLAELQRLLPAQADLLGFDHARLARDLVDLGVGSTIAYHSTGVGR
ncbi:hypothetical protein B484DRAFT_438618, partial [Ochromonadaceae sp. CCMP2298]